MIAALILELNESIKHFDYYTEHQSTANKFIPNSTLQNDYWKNGP